MPHARCSSAWPPPPREGSGEVAGGAFPMRISIITISYNNIEGMRLTAESIACQTAQQFEWVVVDGASTDGTADYLRSLERQPDVLICEPDHGIYDAMNKGMEAARGEYLLYLNSGDCLYNAHIMRHLLELELKADVEYGDLEFCSAKGSSGIAHYPHQLSLPYLIGTALGHPATLIKASALRSIGGYDARHRIVSDWRLWIELYRSGFSFHHCGLCISRFMVGGVSTLKQAEMRDEKRAILSEMGLSDYTTKPTPPDNTNNPHDLCAVVVPVYQPPSALEAVAFRQCLRVLGGRWPIYLVSHQDADLAAYRTMAREAGIELHYRYFAAHYFASVAGYNRLMLSPAFYEQFAEYEYILIHQTDALVWRDELAEWCRRGYDYVGAPIHFRQSDGSMSPKVWGVGNGGLSLRRTQYCLNLLQRGLHGWQKHRPFMRMSGLTRRCDMKWHSYLGLLLRRLGQKNTLAYFLRKQINEDVLFSVYAAHSWLRPRIPDEATARQFAIEAFPSKYFPHPMASEAAPTEQATTEKARLPFGCHAYDKNEFENYWKPLLASLE